MDFLRRKRLKAARLMPVAALLCALFGVCYLLLPSFAQQPQTSDVSATQPVIGTNANWVNGVAPGYWPTAGSGLTLNVSAGTAFCSTAIVTYAGGTLTMTDGSTNYVYLDISSSCAPAVNTSGFTSTTIPIATVMTSGGAIISIADDRTPFWVAPSAAVASIFGRMGTVVAQSGDYSASQVTNAFDLSANNNLGTHYFDIGTQAAPANPASGSDRVYADSTTGQLACLKSSGASCFPTTGSNFADAEVPSGSTGTTFTLAHTPSPAASLILVWDGLVRKQGNDYNLAGATITTSVSVNPSADNLEAWYRY